MKRKKLETSEVGDNGMEVRGQGQRVRLVELGIHLKSLLS